AEYSSKLNGAAYVGGPIPFPKTPATPSLHSVRSSVHPHWARNPSEAQPAIQRFRFPPPHPVLGQGSPLEPRLPEWTGTPPLLPVLHPPKPPRHRPVGSESGADSLAAAPPFHSARLHSPENPT